MQEDDYTDYDDKKHDSKGEHNYVFSSNDNADDDDYYPEADESCDDVSDDGSGDHNFGNIP